MEHEVAVHWARHVLPRTKRGSKRAHVNHKYCTLRVELEINIRLRYVGGKRSRNAGLGSDF